MTKRQISEKTVAALPVPETGNKVHFFSGAQLQGKKAPTGFGVRVTAAGVRSFVWFHRSNGQKHLETIGSWRGNEGGGNLSVLDAVMKCADRARAVAMGVDRKGNDVDPRPDRTRRLQDGGKAESLTVSRLLDQFVDRYVEREAKLRTAAQIKDTFDRLVKPAIGKHGIYDIRRSHVVEMLDAVSDRNGSRMSDLTLAFIRKAFNWYALRDDEFRSPIVSGMARVKPSDRARTRILADDEIRDLWHGLATVQPVCFRAYVKTLLLTATRRNEAARMTAGELDGDIWTIPGERYKTGLAHVIPLSAMARELIGTPKGFVFSTTKGEKAFSGFAKSKTDLDNAIAAIRQKAGREPMPNWTLHDLRRTARTLMSRAKVPSDHAERALGHVIGGVRGVYDRFEYLAEKRDAFQRLAAMVDAILNPESNVVALRR